MERYSQQTVEFCYVLRRCPVHDQYIPQLLQVPMSLRSPQQAVGAPQRFPRPTDHETITTTYAVPWDAKCTHVYSSIPVTTERVQIPQRHNPRQVGGLQRSSVPPSPLAPNIMSTSILPQFPPATTGSGPPAFGYPFCPPLQFPTPSVSFSMVKCTPPRLTQHAPPQAPMESFPPTDGPGHPAVSYFQPQAPVDNFQPRFHSVSPPTSTLLPVPNVATVPHQLVQQDALHRTRPRYTYVALITMAITSSPHEMATLADICNYISANFPYYKHSKKPWKKSVSVCLTNSHCFKKAPFVQSEITQQRLKQPNHSRNNLWVIDSSSRKILQEDSGDRRTLPRKRPRQDSVKEMNEYCIEYIPNQNTSIAQLIPSVRRETRGVCVLPFYDT